MSPDAKRLVRPTTWDRLYAADKQDLIVFLACSHLAMLIAGYWWGHA